MRCNQYDVIVFENLRFARPHEYDKSLFSKISTLDSVLASLLGQIFVSRTSNFRGTTVSAIVPRQKRSIVNRPGTKILYCLYRSPLILPRVSSKIILNYFQLFYTKAVEARCKIWKFKTDKDLLKTISIVYFLPIRVFFFDGRVFLSRNYRLIVAPRKSDVLKTNICLSDQF